MIGGKIAAAAMMATVLGGAVVPAAAEARGWGGRGHGGGWGHRGYGHYRGHGDGVFGAIVGGLVVGGLIAAVSGAGDRDGDGRNEADRGPRSAEDAAVDQCAARVENETAGTVDTIDTVDRFADGWRVRGTVDAGKRAEGGYQGRDSFACSIVNGRIDNLSFGSEGVREPVAQPAP